MASKAIAVGPKKKKTKTSVEKKNGLKVPEVRIGEKVRGLRKKHGHSIQKLAELSGVSPAGIYKIETNGMVPTITTLVKLATALEKRVSYFVEEEDTLPDVRLVRKGERTVLASGQEGRTEVIAERLRHGRIDGVVRVLESGASSKNPHTRAGGEQLIYCLKGELSVRRGEETFQLKEGDSFQCQSNARVFFENGGRAAAQFLIVHADGASA